MKKNKAKLNKFANRSFRIAIIIFAYGTVAYELLYKRDIKTLWQSVVQVVNEPFFAILLSIIFLLMFLNIGLETEKWRFLVKKLEKINFRDAAKSVLIGMTVGIFTPQKIGSFFGRAFVLKETNPWKGVVVSIIGSFSQLLATLSFGTVGVLFMIKKFNWVDPRFETLIFWGGFTVAAIILTFLFLFYFKVGVITDLVSKTLKNNKFKIKQYLRTLSAYSNKELLIVFLYSCSRYLIFSFQFWLSFRVFGIKLPLLEGFLLITVIYFALAVIPTIALAELGIRGSVSLFILQFWSDANGIFYDDLSMQIFIASSIIWLINIMLPSLIGTLFIKELNFWRKKS
ncbi:MAG: lysylphosphatidylglycerol synthase transmembrane domain-containing protein [Bacteroidales bacterium]|nr:lysylphosphatidylglycerol synthase transmembrane domain-containing protein [Bacteroidales bacterium]